MVPPKKRCGSNVFDGPEKDSGPFTRSVSSNPIDGALPNCRDFPRRVDDDVDGVDGGNDVCPSGR